MIRAEQVLYQADVGRAGPNRPGQGAPSRWAGSPEARDASCPQLWPQKGLRRGTSNLLLLSCMSQSDSCADGGGGGGGGRVARFSTSHVVTAWLWLARGPASPPTTEELGRACHENESGLWTEYDGRNPISQSDVQDEAGVAAQTTKCSNYTVPTYVQVLCCVPCPGC